MADQIDMFSGTGGLPVPGRAERLIPLGKYKHQPYEVLLQDPQYALWLMNALIGDLQRNHPEFLAFIVSRFGSSDRTPAHNCLQNRFLDEQFALQFALATSNRVREISQYLRPIDVPTIWANYVRQALLESTKSPEWETRTGNAGYAAARLAEVKSSLLLEAKHLAVRDGAYEPVQGELPRPVRVHGLEFEDEGSDVFYKVGAAYWLTTPRSGARHCSDLPDTNLASYEGGDVFRVEVKPLVGDDYPSILRAMKAVKGRQLLVGEYCGTGATWQEVVRVFGLSNITVALVDEVERVAVPASFDCLAVKALAPEEAAAVVARIHAEILRNISS